MRQLQRRWAQGRRTPILCALFAAGLMAAPLSAFAQDAAPAAQQAPAQQAPPGISFDSDAGILIMYIKPDKTTDFETAMAKLKDAIAKSEKPEYKQMAAGWKLYKAAEPGPNGAVTYVNMMSPALKGADYTMTKILYDAFPNEAQEIFPLLRDSFAGGMGKLSLTTVEDYSTVSH